MKTRVDVKVDWKGPEVIRATRAAARKALGTAAEEILKRANELVPLDEGTLQASGEASVGTSDLISVVSYDTPYAVRLHEHPEYEFQGGREGKWLEKTVNENSKDVLKWLADELKKEF